MTDDEQPTAADPPRSASESCSPVEAGRCWAGCPSWPDDDVRPYQVLNRHRGDRRVSTPLDSGWDYLETIEAQSLSWPALRLT